MTASAWGFVVIPQFGPFKDNPESIEKYYNALADALNKLPNAFPRTESKIELVLLRKIFTQEEAWLAGQMTIQAEPVSAIAERVGLTVEETTKRLDKLSNKGAVWGRGGYFRLAPFIVGIYEAQVWNMDHEMAHLMEDYMDEGGAEFMRFQPAIHRDLGNYVLIRIGQTRKALLIQVTHGAVGAVAANQPRCFDNLVAAISMA